MDLIIENGNFNNLKVDKQTVTLVNLKKGNDNNYDVNPDSLSHRNKTLANELLRPKYFLLIISLYNISI